MIRYIEQKLADLQSAHKAGQNLRKYIPSGVDVELILQLTSHDLGEKILAHHTLRQSNDTVKLSDLRPHPLIVWSMLPRETRMSVCHFTMNRFSSALRAVSDLMVIANGVANKISESSLKESCAALF
ncbi:unnamed protein product [Trichobilharzia szidati]|nr:unnamed protein product [Trichobilharzia szidati]